MSDALIVLLGLGGLAAFAVLLWQLVVNFLLLDTLSIGFGIFRRDPALIQQRHTNWRVVGGALAIVIVTFTIGGTITQAEWDEQRKRDDRAAQEQREREAREVEAIRQSTPPYDPEQNEREVRRLLRESAPADTPRSCRSVSTPIPTPPGDPTNLDRDGDGIACE